MAASTLLFSYAFMPLANASSASLFVVWPTRLKEPAKNNTKQKLNNRIILNLDVKKNIP
jgi:hypothetical protein